jgi:hypothetical protein
LYRIFFESIKHLFDDFDNGKDTRIKSMEPYTLLPEGNQQIDNSIKEMTLYKKLQDYLAYFHANIKAFPQFKCLLWTLESRGITARNNGVTSEKEIMEQFEIVNNILKLAYW